MKIHTALLSAVLPVLLSAGAAAQDAVDKAPDAFVLQAGEISIKDLVDQCATYLDVNILSNPQECSTSSPIRLQKAITTDRDGCKDMLTGLLYRAGFALTTIDENLHMYEIIMMTGPRGREIMNRAEQKTNAEVLAKPNLKMPVTTVVQLEHINAQLANNALRPFFASNSGSQASLAFGSVGSRSALLLSGMQDQVAQAIQMHKTCDVAPTPEPDASIAEQLQQLQQRVLALEKQLAKLTEKGESK